MTNNKFSTTQNHHHQQQQTQQKNTFFYCIFNNVKLKLKLKQAQVLFCVNGNDENTVEKKSIQKISSFLCLILRNLYS